MRFRAIAENEVIDALGNELFYSESTINYFLGKIERQRAWYVSRMRENPMFHVCRCERVRIEADDNEEDKWRRETERGLKKLDRKSDGESKRGQCGIEVSVSSSDDGRLTDKELNENQTNRMKGTKRKRKKGKAE